MRQQIIQTLVLGALVAGLLQRRTYQQSETIINVGDEARELYFLARGGVSVFVPLEEGARKRLLRGD